MLVAIVTPEVTRMRALLRGNGHLGLTWSGIITVCHMVEELRVDVGEGK